MGEQGPRLDRGSTLGERYLGPKRQEKARPGAQEAHEAIRPTDPTRRPEDVRGHLTQDQLRLYELIWRRFVASRMAAYWYAGTTAEIAAGPFGLRATGSVLLFDGFYRVGARRPGRGRGPAAVFREGEGLDFHGLEPEQHFTQPPPRYSEATLIKELEERGIGRPSTYASICRKVIQAHDWRRSRQSGDSIHRRSARPSTRLMVAHSRPSSTTSTQRAMESRS